MKKSIVAIERFSRLRQIEIIIELQETLQTVYNNPSLIQHIMYTTVCRVSGISGQWSEVNHSSRAGRTKCDGDLRFHLWPLMRVQSKQKKYSVEPA